MKIPSIVDVKRLTWNKDGKFWFESTEETLNFYDLDIGKYDYEIKGDVK